MRYSQLINIVRTRKPDNVIEIGTWNGARAIEMFNAHPEINYTGFDLFEMASPYTDAKEYNVKPHNSLKQVQDRLNVIGMKATLIKGDTNETLKEWAENHPETADLVYIDGGHSVETIRNDYNNALKLIKKYGVIVFDDYYHGIDVEKFGANKILEDSGKEFEVLPMKDPVVGGGFTQMAIMYP